MVERWNSHSFFLSFCYYFVAQGGSAGGLYLFTFKWEFIIYNITTIIIIVIMVVAQGCQEIKYEFGWPQEQRGDKQTTKTTTMSRTMRHSFMIGTITWLTACVCEIGLILGKWIILLQEDKRQLHLERRLVWKNAVKRVAKLRKDSFLDYTRI